MNQRHVRQYDTNRMPVKWDNFTKAQCPANTVCQDCLQALDGTDVFYTEGDLYIVAIIAVHHNSKESVLECGSITLTGGFEFVEAVKYAIESAKRKRLHMPEGKIGVIVIDSCGDDFLIKEKILNLHRRGLLKRNGEYVDVNDRILGYVGAEGSGVSGSASQILTYLKYVQISFSATSADLSDRSKYPYFLRVSTPDIVQVKVMIELVKKMKSNSIQMIYSEGKYGEDGRDALMEEASKHGVCVVQTLPVEKGNISQYKKVIHQLKQYPNSKVIIVYLRSHTVSGFMKEMDLQVTPMEYVFIGSEAWGTRDFVSDLKNIEGAITLAMSLPVEDGFLEHMRDIDPQQHSPNHWVLPYISGKLNCYYEWSFNKTYGRQCGSVPNDVNVVNIGKKR